MGEKVEDMEVEVVLERIRSLVVQVREKEEEGSKLRRKLREMELSMMAGEEEQGRRLAKGEEKKGEVLARLDQLTKERKQLLEVKAGLDLEIGMYHCLVATEEERLGLQPGPKEEKQVTQETQAPIEVEREELKTETKKNFS